MHPGDNLRRELRRAISCARYFGTACIVHELRGQYTAQDAAYAMPIGGSIQCIATAENDDDVLVRWTNGKREHYRIRR